MRSHITKELLFSHFSGRTSPIQKKMIDEWAREIANEETYYRWLDEYEQLYPEYQVNLDGAIDRYHQHARHQLGTMNEDSPTEGPGKTKGVKGLSIHWAVASSVLLLVMMGSYLFRDRLLYQAYSTQNGEIKSLILSDGSSVVLNANSTLKVPRYFFGSGTRHVVLIGEANFNVVHTSSHQRFVVETPNRLDIEVLGTEFTVYARSRGSKVMLRRGKVRLNLESEEFEKSVSMKPGDLIVLDKKNKGKLSHSANPDIHTLWADHRFVFERTTLLELSQILEDNYSIHTTVNDKALLNLTLSGTFTAKSENEMLDLISQVLDLQIIRKKDHIFISKQTP
ncbi:FecR family protein [Dyadobacter tibetensis]|uniref:FecR family protein n=1 Tax=Dyadobacter tibetensis TaxID=1211851 RepID=UPI000472E279|nr:FecR domain-containing protein [Dyadobacter tibetensis]